jgi:hypothetical protein
MSKVIRAGLLLMTALVCGTVYSAEQTQKNPVVNPRESELIQQDIDRVMDWLAENDPQQAQELQVLLKENPQEFRARVRHIHEGQLNPSRRFGGWRSRQPIPEPGGPILGPEKPGPEGPPKGFAPGPGAPQGPEMMRGFMQQRYAEFIKWLEQHYPEEAQKLNELRENKSELYHRQAAICWRRYHRIMEAQEENPKVAEVLKEDLELVKESNRLLERIKTASNEQEKKGLKEQLKMVVGQRFDLIVKRKLLEYEELRNRLQELEKQVKLSQEKLERLKESKEEKVTERVQELLEGEEKIKWD